MHARIPGPAPRHGAGPREEVRPRHAGWHPCPMSTRRIRCALFLAFAVLAVGPGRGEDGEPRILPRPFAIDNLDAAERVLQATAKAQPERADVRMWLAVVAERRGDPARARAFVDTAIGIDPWVARNLGAHLQDPAQRARLEALDPGPEPVRGRRYDYGVTSTEVVPGQAPPPWHMKHARWQALRAVEQRTRGGGGLGRPRSVRTPAPAPGATGKAGAPAPEPVPAAPAPASGSWVGESAPR